MDRGAWWATVHGVAKESDTTLTKQQQTYNNLRYIVPLSPSWARLLENELHPTQK